MALTKLQPSGVNLSANFSFANVTSTYFIGDGGLLTNIAVSGGTAITNGSTNVATGFNGNVTFGVNGTANVVVVSDTQVVTTGTYSGQGLSITNSGTVNFGATGNVSLGAIANLHITGGTNGQVLTTDGTGTLTWTTPAPASSPGGSNTYVQFNDANTLNGTSGLTFNKVTNMLTADKLTVSTSSNLGAAGNIVITGGSSGYVLQTDGAGNLSWTAQTGGGGGGGSTNKSYYWQGPVAVNTGVERIYTPVAITLQRIACYLGGAGSTSTTVVVKKNGSSTLNTSTITGGNTYINTVTSISLVANDYITIDVTAAGTGATDLYVILIIG